MGQGEQQVIRWRPFLRKLKTRKRSMNWSNGSTRRQFSNNSPSGSLAPGLNCLPSSESRNEDQIVQPAFAGPT